MRRLGIWIGLDFEGYTKGKRPLRRLRRGVIAFGQENLPVRVHGDRHVAVEDAVTAAPSPPRRLVPPGMVQSRTVSDVGATGFEQPPILSGKPANVIPGGAECGALPADSAASTPDAALAGGADPLLALVIEAWPTLTAQERLAVVERIATKLCASGAAPRRRADERAPRSRETNFRRRGTQSAPRLAHDADQY